MGKLFHLCIMWMCGSRGGDSASSSTEWLISCGCLSFLGCCWHCRHHEPFICQATYIPACFFLLSSLSFHSFCHFHATFHLVDVVAAVERILYSAPTFFLSLFLLFLLD